MYILLLWGRYLRTRRQAFICIVCVMLGVATLIVVNSVMAGFSTKLKDRLHGLVSDIVVESPDPLKGFPAPTADMMYRIRSAPVGQHIAAMSPVVETIAIMQVNINGTDWTQRVLLIGVDPKVQRNVGGFTDHIEDPERKANPSFDISPEAIQRFLEMHPPGQRFAPIPPPPGELDIDPAMPRLPDVKNPAPGGAKPAPNLPQMDAPPSPTAKYRGAILGHAIAFYIDPKTREEKCAIQHGDTVRLLTVGAQLDPVVDEFIVCDYFHSGMSDYDGSYIYVPLEYLQRLRGAEGHTNQIQIRLHHYDTKHAEAVRDAIKQLFPEYMCRVYTWEDKQGALLAAISIERGILNVLLFMIVGVAGFGILAIFSMIVTEKTRDIGILKSLGASNGGVRRIFMGYGLLLGLVGAILGTILGLLFTHYINEIEGFVTWATGQQVFDRKIYYFSEIPTDVRVSNVALINLGAMFIAFAFSYLPARKASRMRPVQALRFE